MSSNVCRAMHVLWWIAGHTWHDILAKKSCWFMAGHTWQDKQRSNHRTTYMARHTYEKISLIHGKTYMTRHSKIESSHDIHDKTPTWMLVTKHVVQCMSCYALIVCMSFNVCRVLIWSTFQCYLSCHVCRVMIYLFFWREDPNYVLTCMSCDTCTVMYV